MELGMNFTLECEQECEQEIDGRWIAEVPQLPGVLAYGSSSADAMTKAEVLALRVIADRLENGESEPVSIRFSLSLPASVIGRQPKPKKFLSALHSIGWRVKQQSGSHKTLEHADYPDYIFAFHAGEEIGSRMLARIAKHTGFEPGDL